MPSDASVVAADGERWDLADLHHPDQSIPSILETIECASSK